jgi:hypothetical protein
MWCHSESVQDVWHLKHIGPGCHRIGLSEALSFALEPEPRLVLYGSLEVRNCTVAMRLFGDYQRVRHSFMLANRPLAM